MFSTTDLKKGLKIEIDKKVFVILKSDHTNPGKGSAFVKALSSETGAVIEKTFKSGVSTGALPPDLKRKKWSICTMIWMDLTLWTKRAMKLSCYQSSFRLERLLEEGVRCTILYYNKTYFYGVS